VTVLAWAVIVAWIAATFTWALWKRTVTYPRRPFGLTVFTLVWEVSALALAVWVLGR
jgi:hypothetical protein